MPDVVKHGWTHRPRSQGGTDPVPVASDLKWATLTQFDKTISRVFGIYTMKFDVLGTNDTSMFELGAVTGGETPHLQLNEPGYYWALFGMTITGSSWGATDQQLEPYVGGTGGPLDGANNTETDWMQSQFAPGPSFISGTPTLYKSLWEVTTFHWEPGGSGSSDLSSENPLLLGLRVLAGASGDRTMTAQIHVMRISSTGATVTTA